MKRWTINPSRLLVLMCGLLAIVTLLILPDVDPPDTAFHQGTAPLVVHARSSSAPSLTTASAAFQGNFSAQVSERRREHSVQSAYTPHSSLPLLHRSLRC